MNLQILKDFACQHNIDPRVLYAILMNESNAKGFDNGKMKQRFEPGIYVQFSKVKRGESNKCNSLPSLDPKWIRQHDLNQLQLMATSYGIAQIMGWQYVMLGYKSIEEMIEDYQTEDNQVKNFCLFCLNHYQGRFLKALQTRDFSKIAQMYNGTAYKINKYDIKLLNNFNEATKIIL